MFPGLGARTLVWICALIVGQNGVSLLNLFFTVKEKKKANSTYRKILQDKKKNEVMLKREKSQAVAGRRDLPSFGG